jgi:hypothetical protein
MSLKKTSRPSFDQFLTARRMPDWSIVIVRRVC